MDTVVTFRTPNMPRYAGGHHRFSLLRPPKHLSIQHVITITDSFKKNI